MYNFREPLRQLKRSTLMRFIFANSPIFNTDLTEWHRNRVNLHWWSISSWAAGAENFGDALSPLVCEALLAERGLSFDVPVRQTSRLFALGSILDHALRSATVWGSGLHNGGKYSWTLAFLSRLDIRLVRGPLTRDVLMRYGKKCPEKYGDPAVLLPEFYVPQASASAGEEIVILNLHSDVDYPGSVSVRTRDPLALVDRIAGAKRVVSSSLHGIIVAESYGVPAVLLRDIKSADEFKYRDWYYSTGRTKFAVAHSVREALEMAPPPLPDLTNMRATLRETFPYDLWDR